MISAWLQDVVQAARVGGRLTADLSERLGRDIEVGEVLRTKAGAHVFEGHMDGQPVILKCFRGDGATATPERARAEFDRLRPLMTTGDLRVCDLLALCDDPPCILTERAPGASMQKRLDAMGPGTPRDALLSRCGAWLGAYVGPDRTDGTFGPGFWIEHRRKQHAGVALSDPDDALLRDLLAWMAESAQDLRGAPVSKGAVHGDFTPMNLHLDDAGRIWGFDIQGRATMPIARDLARFIVTWLRSSEVTGTGMPWREVTALSDGLLDETERQRVLPFFLAEQLAGRWAADHIDRPRKARVGRAIEAFLEAAP